MMKRLLAVIFIIFLFGCSDINYINHNDNIPDKDEKLIKEFRSHHNYTNEELKNLQIKYLGCVEDYNIYDVPFKDYSGVSGDGAWTKDGYTFPVDSHTRIIGIKNGQLYTIGNLIHETTINMKELYRLLPK